MTPTLMLKIAIIQFPGLNTEYETRREINRAGMRGEFFRWNESGAQKKLASYDGYVIGGGFSYEDRGRAGIIASLDPIMEILKLEAAKGKPILGICNGAQILVESGLIPGADGQKLVMALARNKRIQGNRILGTGYYNAWVFMKCTAPKTSCMFTWNMPEGEMLHAPIAHGEGRFTTDIENLIPTLFSKDQIVLRYCDRQGVITHEFPVNPNGALFNTAAICNPQGNVMAVMPHLERDAVSSLKLFTSMREALLAKKSAVTKKRVHHLHVKPKPVWPLPPYLPKEKSLQMFISLIITDNEAETFEMTVRNLGWQKIRLARKTHIEVEYTSNAELQKVLRKLIQSGVLLNTNKECVSVKIGKQRLFYDAKKEKFLPAVQELAQEKTYRLLVREKPDFVGMSKLSMIQNRLKFPSISGVRMGTLWEIHIPTKSGNVAEGEFKRLIQTHLFFNPHRQEAMVVDSL